jgi:mono/diheme cytochrome c family protein
MLRRLRWPAAGLVFAAAVAALLVLPSPLQPPWPFAWMPSLVTLREDPDFRREAIGGVLLLAAGAAVLAASLAIRRWRWPALAAGLVLVAFAWPHLDLFFVPAYPTSFYRSPTGFAAPTIVEGASLYPGHCAGCHGADGRGDGALATALPVPPADLTALHLWAHADGELFWWLSHGMAAPEGGMAMPGFADRLSVSQRWALIDYIRAHNGGAEMAAGGDWAIPVRAPDFPLRCGAGATRLRALHGHVVRLVFWPAPSAPVPLPATTPAAPLTVAVGSDAAADCRADDPAIVAAYAVVAGVEPAELAGAQFLIDPEGWLRDLQLPGRARQGTAPDRWQDAALLLADIRDICNHPIIQKEITHAARE